ncbi:hypothetical protein ScalyP_jg3738 [Parmales sp. scaly parma]|nr:hypothetical protein ScalyP_jg3738 [Parmales sp. scaly parma]
MPSKQLPTTSRRYNVFKNAVARKQKSDMRMLFRSLSFATLIVCASIYQFFFTSPKPSFEFDPNRVLEAADNNSTAPDCDLKTATPAVFVVYVLGVFYMFVALAIVCDEFFVPALEEMANEDHMNLSMDVAGATLMAAGGSAPELFTSLIGTFKESTVGFGTIVGSAVFNVLFVIGMCAMFSREVLTLTWWPLFRDCVYYSFGLCVLAFFFGVNSSGIIELWEACVLLLMYFGYVYLMKVNQDIYLWLMAKMGKMVLVDDKNRNDVNISFARPSTFRAGLLKLLMKSGSMAGTAGVGIVSKISGNVEEVFKKIDASGNGLIDSKELNQLFNLLETPVSEADLEISMKELDENNDGQIDFAEFTKWYIKSEGRIKAQNKEAFDAFDENNSGTIDKTELKNILVSLGNKPNEGDIDEALKEMFQSGSPDEITYEEFSAWYTNSMFWTEQKRAAEEASEVAEGVDQNLVFPKGEGIGAAVKWLIFLPLIGSLCLTVPDSRKPGKQKYCYITFGMSICWIGVYSFFMVGWAEIIGDTLGIPPVVMGLTFLAAGTSVPDLLSSVIVARMGEGDMAVSSSIGSNIFDILVGLPMPWIIYSAYKSITGEGIDPATKGKAKVAVAGAETMTVNIVTLLGMLVLIVSIVHISGWKMTKTLGGMMFVIYFVYVVQAVMAQYPFVMC